MKDSLSKVLPISFVIENLELDECTLAVLKFMLFIKFKNDHYDTKNSTRFAIDIDSRDIHSYVL
jgi:hypothetical protein